jgi:cytochrome c peroxidase
MKTRLLLLLAVSTVFIFASCVKDEVVQTYKNYTPEELSIIQKSLNLPEDMHSYTLRLPDHLGGFPVHSNDHQATLGRVLFYDKTLSSNGQISCASCHKAEKGFADDEAFSKGVSLTERTSRNSLGLASFPSFSNHYDGGGGGRLFWDERAGTVVEQSKQSLLNPVEMGVGHMSEVAAKVSQKDYYDVLFRKAFPNEKFMSKEDQILIAIEEFVNSIGCFKTKFDEQMKSVHTEHVNFPGFTTEENLGRSLFMTHCASCHQLGNKFLEVTVANNGLDMVYDDQGVGGITHNSGDMGVFKVPMLRNIALTAPYMHDGRFATLEEVVAHYSTGVKNHPNLHKNLKVGNQARNLNLDQSEKNALVAFLKTLTDTETLALERFSDPFK